MLYRSLKWTGFAVKTIKISVKVLAMRMVPYGPCSSLRMFSLLLKELILIFNQLVNNFPLLWFIAINVRCWRVDGNVFTHDGTARQHHALIKDI